jgi:hypothetical protein
MSGDEVKTFTHRVVSKTLNLVLFLVLLVLGVIGLVLPVIPGLVFLFLALVQLTRLSSRFEILAKGNSWFSRSMRRLRGLTQLSPFEWARLGFWVTARGVVGCVNAVVRLAGRLIPGVSSPGDRLR